MALQTGDIITADTVLVEADFPLLSNVSVGKWFALG